MQDSALLLLLLLSLQSKLLLFNTVIQTSIVSQYNIKSLVYVLKHSVSVIRVVA